MSCVVSAGSKTCQSFLRAERREGLVLSGGQGRQRCEEAPGHRVRGCWGHQAQHRHSDTPGSVLRAFGSELAGLSSAVLSCETWRQFLKTLLSLSLLTCRTGLVTPAPRAESEGARC